MTFCPKCGKLLEYVGDDPAVGCGGISYYQCVDCKSYFQENQMGMFPKPANLTEVNETDSTLKYLLDEKSKKKQNG